MGWRGSIAGRTTVGAGAAFVVLLAAVEPAAAAAAATADATPTPTSQCSAGSKSITITGGSAAVSATAGHPATLVESVTSSATFDGVGLRLQLSTPSGGPAPQPAVSWSFDGGSAHAWDPQWIADPGGGDPYWMNVAAPVGTVTSGRHTIVLSFDPTSSDPQGLFWGSVYLDSLPCDNTLGYSSNQVAWSNDTGYRPPGESGGGSSGSGSGSTQGSTGTGSGSKPSTTPASVAGSPRPAGSASAARTKTAPSATASSSAAAPTASVSPHPTVDAAAVANDAAIPPSSGSSVPWITGLAAAVVVALVGTGTVLRRRRRHLAPGSDPEAEAEA